MTQCAQNQLNQLADPPAPLRKPRRRADDPSSRSIQPPQAGAHISARIGSPPRANASDCCSGRKYARGWGGIDPYTFRATGAVPCRFHVSVPFSPPISFQARAVIPPGRRELNPRARGLGIFCINARNARMARLNARCITQIFLSYLRLLTYI